MQLTFTKLAANPCLKQDLSAGVRIPTLTGKFIILR